MYRPDLPNRTLAELPWQLNILKLHLCWPLKDDVSGVVQFFHDAWTMLVVTFFLETIHADWLYIFANIDDLALITESLCTTFIGMMMFFRIVHLQFNRNTLRKVFKTFFRDIYVSRDENEEIFLACKRSLQPMNFLSVACIVPLILFLLTPIVTISLNYTETGKPYPYKLEFPYDAQKPIPYALTVLYTSWVGVAVATTIAGEDTLVSLIFNHLAKRIHMIHGDLQAIYSTSVAFARTRNQAEFSTTTYAQFFNLLKAAVKKQNQIFEFASDLERLFNPLCFIMLIFSTFLLCVIAFQLATHGVNFSTTRYIFWLCACLFEVFVISEVGQKLIDESQQIATEYYMCNWENLLIHGTPRDNIRLIRFLTFGIARSQKPLQITALKFTAISIPTFLKVLNASLSYFMFLNTMKDIK